MACQKKEEEANIALIKGNILSLTEHLVNFSLSKFNFETCPTVGSMKVFFFLPKALIKHAGFSLRDARNIWLNCVGGGK